MDKNKDKILVDKALLWAIVTTFILVALLCFWTNIMERKAGVTKLQDEIALLNQEREEIEVIRSQIMQLEPLLSYNIDTVLLHEKEKEQIGELQKSLKQLEKSFNEHQREEQYYRIEPITL